MVNAPVPAPGEFAYFELHRAIDGLIYQFDRQQMPDGSLRYRRRNLDVWILHHPDFGWISYDEAVHGITGRPWNALPASQTDHPPEGEWVSKKGNKSYVYQLIYCEPPDSLHGQ